MVALDLARVRGVPHSGCMFSRSRSEHSAGAAPRRVKIWSVTVSVADAAGTGQPICASTTATHAARSSVLLPAKKAQLDG